MGAHQASRTLVKSSPELWAECSDAASLARHLGQFGEIRITKLEPETAVAWEGSAASGTVTLEPSGWGTRVILTVTEGSSAPGAAAAGPVPELAAEPEAAAEPEPAAEAEPASEPEPAPEPAFEPEPAAEAEPASEPDAVARPGGLGRLFARFRRRPAAQPPDEVGPQADQDPAPEPLPVAKAPLRPAPADDAPADDAADDAPAEQALAAALDSLGQAHHRPYSRS